MSITNNGYDTKDEATLSTTPSDGEAGSGGDTLDIWTADRITKINNLAGGTFTNNSSFQIPAGVIGSSSESYDNGWQSGERPMGITAQGLVLDKDGKPQSGTAKITAGDSVLASKSSGGQFLIGGAPLPGVLLGESVPRKAVAFEYDPSVTAVPITRSNTGSELDLGSVQYGAISGTVTDYDGNPVEGEKIIAGGFGTTTDANGDYNVSAPGGTSMDVEGLGETKSKTPAAGSTINVNFQFSRLEVEVLTPGDLDPVVGAEVQIGDNRYKTDENGKATLQNAYIVEYEIVVSDSVLVTADVVNGGSLVQKRVGTAASDKGVDLELSDAGSGDFVDRLTGTFPEAGTEAVSTSDGRLRLFTDNDNETTLVLGEDDHRYETVEVELDLQDGQDVQTSVDLEPKTLVSNA